MMRQKWTLALIAAVIASLAGFAQPARACQEPQNPQDGQVWIHAYQVGGDAIADGHTATGVQAEIKVWNDLAFEWENISDDTEVTFYIDDPDVWMLDDDLEELSSREIDSAGGMAAVSVYGIEEVIAPVLISCAGAECDDVELDFEDRDIDLQGGDGGATIRIRSPKKDKVFEASGSPATASVTCNFHWRRAIANPQTRWLILAQTSGSTQDYDTSHDQPIGDGIPQSDKDNSKAFQCNVSENWSFEARLQFWLVINQVGTWVHMTDLTPSHPAAVDEHAFKVRD